MNNLNKKRLIAWIIQLVIFLGIALLVTYNQLDILMGDYSLGIKLVTALIPIIFNACMGVGIYIQFMTYVLINKPTTNIEVK